MMIYNAPLDDDGNKYWVPVAIKNRDYLIGYLKGVAIIKDILYSTFKNINIDLNFDSIDLILDSTKFNDILINGKRESSLSLTERRRFVLDMIKEKTQRLDVNHIENLKNNNDLLSIECTCGFGFYSWKTELTIPYTNFKCDVCGKLLIDYTNNDDYNYTFDDGGINENKKEN